MNGAEVRQRIRKRAIAAINELDGFHGAALSDLPPAEPGKCIIGVTIPTDSVNPDSQRPALEVELGITAFGTTEDEVDGQLADVHPKLDGEFKALIYVGYELVADSDPEEDAGSVGIAGIATYTVRTRTGNE